MPNNQAEAASFRDPAGFIFYADGQLYRQVNSAYQLHYEILNSSGLYHKLVSEGLLIPHEEVSVTPPFPATSFRVLKPETIPFISYPYEWSFGQLQEAAVITLRIQDIALAHGMVLKDASAYNIQFRQGKAILIDTLSFEIYEPGKPWVAYGQFCRHFLAPLALMHFRDIRLGQLLRVHVDGIPLDLTSKLLPWYTWLHLTLLSHIHLHAKSQATFAKPASGNKKLSVGDKGVLHLTDHLKTAINKLHWSPKGTEWAEYYDETNYSGSSFAHKKRLIRLLTSEEKPNIVWDLGANKGEFSQLAAEKAGLVLAFDIDPAAVEKHYRENRLPNVLPLLLDLTNPSPALGWENSERKSLTERGPANMILALALVHHLAISNNLPLLRIAEFFRRNCQTLIIEFVPKTDSQVQKLLTSRPDIFPEYTQSSFEAIFSTVFTIEGTYPLAESERTLYFMRVRN